MAKESRIVENRIVSYTSPLNLKKIQQMAERQQISKSKIVNEALTRYFTDNAKNKSSNGY